MGTFGPFPGAKARPGRDADHSPTSSVEDMNVKELYLLSPLRLNRFFMGLLSKDIINSDYFSVSSEMPIKEIMKWV
jgi:hypothetical protein